MQTDLSQRVASGPARANLQAIAAGLSSTTQNTGQPAPLPAGHDNIEVGNHIISFMRQDLPVHNAELSLTTLRKHFLSGSDAWLNCPVEELYDGIRTFRMMLAQMKQEGYLKSLPSEDALDNARNYISLLLDLESEDKVPLSHLNNFLVNINVLASLQDTCNLAEIIDYFPVLPPRRTKHQEIPTTLQLQQIKNQCIEVLQDEYMFIARLLLGQTMLEKQELLIDYLLEKEGIDLIECLYARLSDEEERNTYLHGVFDAMLDHYAYALAGFILLADKMCDLCARYDMDTLEKVNAMVACLDAAKGVIQSRNAHMAKEAMQSGTSKKLFPMRFTMMLERLEPIYQSLAHYKEKEVLPAVWGFKEMIRPVKQRRRQKAAAPQKKVKPAANRKTPYVAKAPVAKTVDVSTASPMVNIAEVARDVQKLSLDEPAKSISAVDARNTAPSAPVTTISVSSAEVETEAEAGATVSLATGSGTVAPVLPAQDNLLSPTLLPASTFVGPATEPAQIMMLARNPRLAGLSKRHMATYEQIFSERLLDVKHLALSAVEKLVKQLGGQTKGVGGSRTQILFNNKSVATIEHRHGKDRAGELYKASVALLQRGLAIAGFAPPGWEDKLSRARDWVVNFRNYAAKQADRSGKGI